MSLQISDLHQLTPAVFTPHPHPAVSRIYEFIPSLPIIGELLSRGWQLRSAYQRKSDPYAMHRVVFDVANAPSTYAVGDVHPTATLVNSLNRTRRLSFTIGFFRTICSNQCQTSVLSHDLERVHIIGWHGISLDHLIEKAIAEFGGLAADFEKMRQHDLADGAQREQFARRALSLKRFNDDQFTNQFSREQAVDVLTPRRPADRSTDLFTTFNVLQENLLWRTNEVGKNLNVNLKLWELAKSYLN